MTQLERVARAVSMLSEWVDMPPRVKVKIINLLVPEESQLRMQQTRLKDLHTLLTEYAHVYCSADSITRKELLEYATHIGELADAGRTRESR